MTVEELPERHQLCAQLCLLEGLELPWDAPGAVAAPAHMHSLGVSCLCQTGRLSGLTFWHVHKVSLIIIIIYKIVMDLL